MVEIDHIQSLLSYDPMAGTLRWIISPGRRIKVGEPAGWDNGDGYHRVTICGKRYKAHRVAWALYHGAWPDSIIDHINGNGHDNRISNLRLVSPLGNSQNRRSAQARSATGRLGVHCDGSRFRASIRVNGRKIDLGGFDDPDEAHAAYIAAKRLHHPTCTI